MNSQSAKIKQAMLTIKRIKYYSVVSTSLSSVVSATLNQRRNTRCLSVAEGTIINELNEVLAA